MSICMSIHVCTVCTYGTLCSEYDRAGLHHPRTNMGVPVCDIQDIAHRVDYSLRSRASCPSKGVLTWAGSYAYNSHPPQVLTLTGGSNRKGSWVDR